MNIGQTVQDGIHVGTVVYLTATHIFVEYDGQWVAYRRESNTLEPVYTLWKEPV